ncbi:non-ribosomal peptide synthase/polyketide synthase [Clostridium algidicarnis]|uniref:non-ribosomal peptide synthase/polyketide synthase n=1 Tax=Clostridium algidicarnis TaxID=37659 RepID=UPI003FD8DADA
MKQNINVLKSMDIFEESKKYWSEKLMGELNEINLPNDFPRVGEFRFKQYETILDKEISNKLYSISKNQDLALYVILYSALKIILHRYTGQEDIMVASPIYKTGNNNLECNDYVILRDAFNEQMTCKELLNSSKKTVVDAYQNQYYPLNEFVKDSSIMKVWLLLSSIHETHIEENNKDIIIKVLKDLETSNIKIELIYNSKIFSEGTIHRFTGNYINVLTQVINNTSMFISSIEVVTNEEKEKLTRNFNNTYLEYDRQSTIQRLFEKQVEKSPDSIALVYNAKMLTYKELNEKANQLARVLRTYGVKQDTIVGLMVERSLNMIVGILGILKAGGAYLPIDPEYPNDRIKYMIEDSHVNVLVTQKYLTEKFEFCGNVIYLNDELLMKEDESNLQEISSSKKLAYIIYTSGSTGKPKGVAIENRNLVAYVHAFFKEFSITSETISLQQATFCFDAFVEELYPVLLKGGRVVIADKYEVFDIYKLENLIIRNNINMVSCSPLLINELNKRDRIKNVSICISGGDVLKYEYISNILKHAHVYNTYGPTEATVCATYYKCNDDRNSRMLIGKPISNYKIYVLDNNNNLKPIGVAGELCISGEGLARGYVNRNELTTEKFIANPFDDGKLMYKTGDLVRWTINGNIEFLGRIDNQIKLRGFRIELGEIESKLQMYRDIDACIVVPKQNSLGDKCICAYLVSQKQINIRELRDYLLKELPEYMVPAYFIQLEKIPFNSNGKIDKKALPSPSSTFKIEDEYEAPRNSIEEGLIQIWESVLQVDSIGINHNFFELGGHSLNAAILSGRIREVFNVEVPIREIFNTPTIKGVGAYIELADRNKYIEIKQVEEKEYYETSSSQKRLYALQQLEKDNTGYNMPYVMTIEGKLEKEKLENVINHIIRRHETLRTSFHTVDGEIVQKVEKELNLSIKYVEDKENNIKDLIDDFIRAFDLSIAPLLRVELIMLEENKHLLMFDMHHIISDGVSLAILINEFAKLYEGKELENLRVQYKDYASWQNELLISESIKKQEEYWMDILNGELPVLNMQYDYARPSIQSFEGNNIDFRINNEVAGGLKKLASETGSTLYMVLLSAFNILLHKYSGQEDVIVGTPIAGRLHADLQNIIGMFVNTLPMRNYPQSSKTYEEFLLEVKENSLKAYENQDYQFETLVDKLTVIRDLSRNPIFDVMFSLDNIDDNEHSLKDLNIRSYEFGDKVSKFDISLAAAETENGIEFNFEYCTKLFTKETMNIMAEHYINILKGIVADKSTKLLDIEIMSEKEKSKLLYDFNDTKKAYDKNKTIQELFEEQVEKTPDNIAVIFEDKKLTYRDLNEKANSLAKILRDRGVKGDSIVGIMVERSLEMIVGIIGILKSGGAYLPIDPNYPQRRIEYMLKDSKIQILLSRSNLVEPIEFHGEIIDLFNQEIFINDSNNLEQINNSSNLAYVIYTSGTTGNPKGVMIEHKQVNNFIKGIVKETKLNIYKNILCITTICFDIFGLETLVPLTQGLMVAIANSEEQIDGNKLGEFIKKNDIEIMQVTPSRLKILLDNNIFKQSIESLKVLLIGGEQLNRSLVTKLHESIDAKIYNVYGPTETTIWSTAKELNRNENVTIGKPISNTKVYIFNNNVMMPIGLVGELCIAGDGVTRGYLNRPELTSEKFIDNPFEPGTMMYKTGDLARWLPDGNIEFLGRMDNQVKIRGFRIELGEIENRLLEHEYIKETSVVIKKNKELEKYICAYVISGKYVNELNLKSYLKESLPEYMVPDYFVQLDKMPLTSSGKINHKMLPEPNVDDILNEYEAPRNELEETLVKIWSEVLGIEKIGINDNFFEVGGHSLKAMAIVSKIHKELNKEIPLKELFKSLTIKELSSFIQNTEENIYSGIEKVEERDYYEASSAQKRMYMLQQFEPDSVAYNMPEIIELEGEINRARIEDVFKKLVFRHEGLRTYFITVGGEIVQKIDDSYELILNERIYDENIEQVMDNFVRPFELDKAPLFRAELIECKGKNYLIMDMHHIISDRVSVMKLTYEFANLYNGKDLEPLKRQYKDFAVWQNNFLKSEEIKKQEEYWMNIFNDEIPVLNLNYDYQRPTIQSFEGDSVHFSIDMETTKALRKMIKETGTTMNMVLLSAFNILLSKYSGQEDIVVGAPIAGRTHADLQNIMGMFVNTLALRNKPEGNKKYVNFLKEVKENSLMAYENQSYQIEVLIKKLDVKRDTSRNPLFDVTFNMIDVEDSSDIQLNDVLLKQCSVGNNIAKFDLTLNAMDNSDNIEFSMEYCIKLFKKETIERLISHYVRILKVIANNIEIKLYEIDMLSEKEKNQILYDFNDTKVDYPKNKTIQEVFETQVDNMPDNIAVVFENKKLTYRELNEKANNLAKILRNKGIKVDSIVGIMVDRSMEMIIGIMGVLKAGGAYLPIDPSYPRDRIEYMLKDSNCSIMLSQQGLMENIEFDGGIIDLFNNDLFDGEGSNLEKINNSNSLAYVIYTSGTTGKSKGVMVKHHSIVNYANAIINRVSITSSDETALLSSYAFDLGYTTVFTALLVGAKLNIISEEKYKNPEKLIELLKTNITYIKITPSMFSMIVNFQDNKEVFHNSKLRLIILGGEDINIRDIDKFIRMNNTDNISIMNHYGPTESTIGCIATLIDLKNLDNFNNIIGKPISNVKAYILDKDKGVLGIGIKGELFISGEGLAKGYLNRPDLTAERFIDSPFEAETKIYKTGDLVRWLPDGNIEFLGRIDNQVKIRGFRIELDEIESRLLQNESIKEAVVVVRENKEEEKYICAYVISEKSLEELNLRIYLKETLPEYMIPSYFIKIDKFPLTENGKLHRRLLPEPNLEDNLNKYEAPRNKVEEILCKIWSEVLGVKKIGINDNFFEVGGHSLKAMVLLAKIHKDLNKEIPLKELFKLPTIKELSEFVEAAEETVYTSIEKVKEGDLYETSSAQKRMYIIQRFDKENVAYNVPRIFEIQGVADIKKIEDTFRKLIKRHETLRTYFETVEEEIVQKIDINYIFNLETRTESKSIEEIANDFVKPFDLGKAPLFRVEIVESKGKNYLLIDIHHIISDGVSMRILINEFTELYNGRELGPLNLQYRDFATWQNNYLMSEKIRNEEEYWINIFNEEIPVLNLPYDYERPVVQSFEGDSMSFEVDKELSTALKTLIKKTGTTMHMVLLSAFNILLSKYSGQEDIVIGTPIAGRPHSDLQSIIGMFVNTLALRNRPEGNKKYIDFLNEVKENSLKAYENQSYQLESLIEKLDIVRDTSRNTLFDVMFNMIDTISDNDVKLNDMSLIPYNNETNVVKFDLTLNAMEQGEAIIIDIDYCSKLFNKDTIERLSIHYIKILESIINNNEVKLSEISIVSNQERDKILYNYNNTKVEYPKYKTLQEIFELQVEKSPNNIAVIFGDEKITYKKLNEKSNKLARVLREKGVGSNKMVGVMLNRSIDMIIGIMGIIKAGGAYLPIEPIYPEDRIRYILENSNAKALVTRESYTDIDNLDLEKVYIDDETIYSYDCNNLENSNEPQDLAYTIYTSGSTGNPKGVMITHESVINTIQDINTKFNVNENDRIIGLSSVCFDLSVYDIFGSLSTGATLVEISDHRNVEEISRVLKTQKITIWNSVPAIMDMFVESIEKTFYNTDLRLVLLSGDWISLKLPSKIRKYFNNPNIISLGGATEASIWSIHYPIGDVNQEWKSIPYGMPLANQTFYVLDKSMNLCPYGVAGELYIGGIGVAKGYMNDLVKTQKAFMSDYELGNLYRTGDWGRFNKNGYIEFLGRIDNQVKIRGFRIELGEIENKLLQNEDVKQAIVIVSEGKDEDKYICAYIISDKEIMELGLKYYLKESLPEYMIPSYFVKLDKIPITSNGKLDRRALPKPNLEERLTRYEAPRNTIEETLAKIWSEVLGVDKIGINDSFFELGGHSLKAMTLISKINKETNKEIPLKELFITPTIKGMSKFIESAKENIYSNIEKIGEKDYYKASSAQKRMYIIQGFDKESIAYNMPQFFEIQGTMDKNRIEATFKALVIRHEALRTYFDTVGEEIVQKIDNNYEFELKGRMVDQDIEEIVNNFVKFFNLNKAPLFRAEIVITKNKSYLLIDMHHIISDGVSMSILINEFVELYNGGELQPLNLQYKDFAAWQNNFLKSEEMKKQEEYWVNIFSDEIPVLNMPTDYERPVIQTFDGDIVSFKLDEKKTRDLRNLSKETGTTMNMILLSIFNILLSKYSGQEDVIVGVPIVGRPHADLQNIMGMFVNTLALRNRPEGDKKYVDFLNEVKENCIKAYENQSYQLETLVDKLSLRRDTSRNPLFDVMFNIVDTFEDNDFELNGLSLKSYDNRNKISKFDLTLNAIEDEKVINFSIEYCSKLFKKDTIEKLSEHYIAVINNITKNHQIKISEIDLLEENEKNQILYDFNNTKANYPKDKTIQEVFEEQVEKTPYNIAVVYENEKLTYKELNKKVNMLAQTLRKSGVSPEKIVGIMVNRSIDMVVGILAIIKSGGAYMPIDPNYPDNRIDYMMKNSNAQILITESRLVADKNLRCKIIDITDEGIYSKDETNLEIINTTEDLLYVIYTSGTTANPKGVMIEQRNLINMVYSWIDNYSLNSFKVNLLQMASVAFDVFTGDLCRSLLTGGTMYICPSDIRINMNNLYKLIKDKEISILESTPSLVITFMEYVCENNFKLDNLKLLILGSDTCPVEEYKKLVKKYGQDMRILNSYGVTEATIDSSYYEESIDNIPVNIVNTPIGRPLKNTKFYILNDSYKLQPIGVIGELYIGGLGVARGYYNNEELTSKKFIANPFEEAEVMYKTGDLARWLADGNVEFLGRMDNQVKIRGFRIELGEIENKLLQHECIKEALVIAIENNDEKYICAYVVSRKDINELDLKKYVKESLPEYMVPSYFVQLEKMPLTPNGKVDRKSLPKPNLEGTLSSYEAPANEVQEKLCKIWSEVLKVKKVGINDNFFELGGHSLKAMTLISKIHKETDREVPLKELFKSPTIKELSDFIERSEENIYFNIEKIEDKEYYEASSAQKRMYVIQEFDKESVAYNMPQIFEIEGILDKNKIEDTFRRLINRHEALRTYFEIVDDEIVQKINNHYEFELKDRVDEHDIEEISNNFVQLFDLSKSPLFRAEIVRNKDKNYLLIDMHHIISDGLSMSILINEFATLYNGGDLEPLKLQYKDFAVWQNNFLKSQEMKKQEEYWTNIFNDEIPVLSLTYDYERPAIQSFKGNNVGFEVDTNLTSNLRELTKKTGTTMNMVLLSAFNILLYKYSGQEDIVVGTPIAGRPHADLQNIMGMFVNTLALRNKPEGAKKYIDFLNEVKENSLKAYDNQSYQLETLIEKLDIVRDTSRNPLFDVMFNMVDMVSDIDINLNDISLIPYDGENNVAKFDLTLSAIEESDEFTINIGYCSKLFNKNSIERLGKHYLSILESIVNNNEIKLSEINLLNDGEKSQLLNEFNDTNVEYSSDKTIQELFEAQVKKIPDNIAVVFEDKKLTYRELNEKSNSLAKILRNKGVKADSIVGIMVDRSLEMVIGIMGILKAGGAYLPIDSSYPKQRIEYILSDSESKVLLTTEALVNDIEFKGEIIDLYREEFFNCSSENLERINNAENLAYVIYTSGTTGNPKGAMLKHLNLNNFIMSFSRSFNSPIGSKDKVLSLTNYVFDVSVCEVFVALISGATLVINDKHKTFNPLEISNLIVENKITFTYIPPLLLTNVYEELKKSNREIKLNKLLVGVEAIRGKTLNNFYELNKQIEIINGYGPTESTICSTFYKVNGDEIEDKVVPIGKPVGNTKIYILNNNKLQPICVPGELCISGDGLARGYLNKPELTSEKFVDNPFDQGTRMYKTGDLARWLPDGNIEFLGRIDNQVKIRGFRIELGEIESRILQHEDVKEVTVMVIDGEDNDKCICSYIVSDKELSELNLREYLKESLPEYMIPSYFVKLGRMPMTSNGKLDRRALPKPNLDKRLTSYEAPRNEVEETLVKIWSEVLGAENIGINDSFFELGGHSLKAMTLISKIHKETNKEVSLKELFKSPTIKGLSKFIEEVEESIYSNIEKIEEREYYEASSAQKRMYIIQGFDKESMAYNMPQVFEIQGSIDKATIEDTFKKLIKRHEALRTYFETVEDEIVQKIDKDYEFKLKEKTSHGHIEEIVSDFIKPFDLSKAPLFRVEIVETQGGNYLLLDMHHIISDGVSMSVLISEFVTLYNGGRLEQLKLQYKDFAAWQNNFLKSEEIKKQEEYWIEMFKDEIPVLNMATDYERPAIQSFEGDSVNFEVDKNVTSALRNLTKKTGTTMHMVLLSAFNILLSKYSGQEDIVVGTPISGRPHDDLQNIMGMFVNTLPLRNKLEGDKKYIDFLNEVKENSLKAYENQSYQLEVLIEKLDVVRDTSRNPLFDVMFNMVDTVSNLDIKLNDMALIPYGSENNVAKFDLTLNAMYSNEKLSFSLQYCSKLFNKATIERLCKHYIKVLETIINDYEIQLGNVDLLLDQERKQILYDFNDTQIDYANSSTVQQLFESQVEKTPNNIAVVFQDKTLTYRELNEKSNSLAMLLKNKGVKPNSIVSIMIERSLEMSVGIMGILKAGAAYLPIDPSYPKQRIEYMLEDSESKLLLSKDGLVDSLEFTGEIIDLSKEDLFIGNIGNSGELNNSSDLAYVIYTSGTTGKPKGVLVSHQSLTETLLWRKQEYGLSENHVILPIFNYVFDGFVINFFTPLISGSKVVLVNNYEMSDPYKLVNYIRTLGVTHYISVPSIYLAILGIVNKNDLDTLKVVTLAGEKMPPKAVEYTKKLKANIEIVNEYGPTENTVVTTIMRDVQSDRKISIGKPIANTTVYILNSSNKMQPIGVPGEVFIGGSRLAKGYLNRPALDTERFIQSFYCEGEKLYRTGDFARWLPDGSIDFIDRIDNQVKIRGFRIELGEIENILSYHEEVKEANVLVIENEDKEKYLCAYVVSEKELNALNLKNYLKENLPTYMIPSYFVQLDKMPITPNGKIDRKALPKPNLDELTDSYEAPRNEMEESLVEIWKDVLNIKQVGINDNFFEIGGHSLKATKLIARINKEFKIEISIKDVFYGQTIKELSHCITESKKYSTNISNDNVILLKSSDENSSAKEENLFIIHDGSGDIGGYIELTSNLKDNIKCWAIKADKEAIYNRNNLTIEELAETYIKLIKNIQPIGSYNIAGWSLGGVIAFEMARQLEKSGNEIRNLILIDSYINPNLINYTKVLKEDVSLDTEKKNLISYINNNNIKEKIYKESTLDKKWNIAKENLSKEDLDEIKLRLPEEFTSIMSNIEELSLEELLTSVNIIRRLTSALKSYKPKNKVKVQSVLYKAKEESKLNVDKWNKYFEKSLVVEEVSGNHYTIVKKGKVEYIEERLNEVL